MVKEDVLLISLSIFLRTFAQNIPKTAANSRKPERSTLRESDRRRSEVHVAREID